MNINEVLPNPFLLRMAMLLGVEQQFAGVQGTMGSQIVSSAPLWVVGYIGDFPFPLIKSSEDVHKGSFVGPAAVRKNSLTISSVVADEPSAYAVLRLELAVR